MSSFSLFSFSFISSSLVFIFWIWGVIFILFFSAFDFNLNDLLLGFCLSLASPPVINSTSSVSFMAVALVNLLEFLLFGGYFIFALFLCWYFVLLLRFSFGLFLYFSSGTISNSPFFNSGDSNINFEIFNFKEEIPLKE